MIAFSRLGKQYGRQVLFVDASFQLNPGEKVGLVGPNGSGKTTLFRMIVGEDTPDEGDVSVPRRLTIGYFRQDVEEMSGRSVLDEAIAGSGDLGDLHHELEALQHAMADPSREGEIETLLERFGHVQEAYEQGGGYDLESRAREVLHGLGFEVPAGATMIQGDFGFVPGAYLNAGHTNGAQFTVFWSDGGARVVLHERYLDPVSKLNDRGLQHFSARLPKGRGSVICRIDPGEDGEFAFDWTGWTGIEFK